MRAMEKTRSVKSLYKKEEYEAVKELDKILLQQLSRVQAPHCPSVDTLGDFLDGKDSSPEQQVLEAHLRGCPSCVNHLITLRELARLEQEGEEPPAALVNEVKRLVHSQEPAKVSASSVVDRARETFAATWTWLWQWASPRFLGEIVTVSAVAVFVFSLRLTLLQQPLPHSPGREEQIKAIRDLTIHEQRVLTALSLAPAGSDPLHNQLVATLEKLPENLLLEETRGVTNVEVYKRAAPAIVLVVTDQSLGSGVVISSQGEVLTNWHVIQGASRMAVVFKPQKGVENKKTLAFVATPVKVDQVIDLALLKIQAPPQNMSVLSLGEITSVEVGQEVHLIGHPDGKIWTYTASKIISQIRPNYQWTGADKLLHQGGVIQTQTPVDPGTSGGQLLNDQAEIIGINSFRDENNELNYAIAVDGIEAFLAKTKSQTTALIPSPLAASYRTESYGPNIVGMYRNAQLPPPDVWFVSQGSGKQLAYSARGSETPTQIDTVIQGADPEWQSLVYYFDIDCNGEIDLIGFDADGDGVVDRYGLPQEPFPLASLAQELTQALQQGTIPYSQLRVCQ